MSASSTPVVSPALLVSLASTPWLITIVTLNTVGKLLEQSGLASEEVFRGDRLPVLHLPVSETTTTDQKDCAQNLLIPFQSPKPNP